MITLEESINIVLENAPFTGTERIDFTSSLNRVLAEDIFSDMDMPPFDKSAMDGYACRMKDIGLILEVMEVIPAGKQPFFIIEEGQCSQIMTGAMIPPGADCVLMVEDVEKISENAIKYNKDKTFHNICYRGEDIKSGEIVLKKGIIIQPQHIATMASSGATNPLVAKKPKVGILSTGDEIIEPYNKPGNSQIRNSNAYQLLMQSLKLGAETKYFGIAADNKESTFEMITKAMEESDLVLLTGGVSMGEFDFVPEVMKKIGIEILFQKINVQPGKPTTFGVKDNKRIIGLPGNPVSSFIQFELVVKPLIYKMMGHAYLPPDLMLPLGIDYFRRKSDRMAWFPVKISDQGEAIPVSYHGSAHLFALNEAYGLSYIQSGETSISKGTRIHVRQI